MIGLDTNVLIRYLTQDDPAQAAKVSRVIDAATTQSLFLSSVVLCETVWVLEEAYKQKRDQIVKLLESILLTGQFAFDDKELLWLATDDYRRGKADFADYIIGRIASRSGCRHTLTFDRALKGDDLFQLL